MKKIALLVSVCAMLQAGAAIAAPAEADLSCQGVSSGALFSVGPLPDAAAQPVLVPVEIEARKKGLKNADLGAVRFNATSLQSLPADYAMMRLSKLGGRPLWVVTQDGDPAPEISMDLAAGTLEDAFDRIAVAANRRWVFDGTTVYLLNRQEWTILLPKDRDLAIAVQTALKAQAGDAKVYQGLIHIEGDKARADEVSSVVAGVYAQPRITPFDVTWYKVYPTAGVVDWSRLPERTDAVRDIGFSGRGANVVLDGDANDVLSAFLAGEGEVRVLGKSTMVPDTSAGRVSRVAGCGSLVDGTRGLELSAESQGRGGEVVRYTMTGAKNDVQGRTMVARDGMLVVASSVPTDGAYLVAAIKPRVLEVSSSSNVQAPSAMAAGSNGGQDIFNRPLPADYQPSIPADLPMEHVKAAPPMAPAA